ncbi:MAG: LysM peptidoglycan-binding domain-containing protein, partial [Bacteroidota bacterium]
SETLFGIARLYGLDVAQLRLWNGLTNDRIYPCSKLVTVAPGTSNNAPSGIVVTDKGGGAGTYHTVQKNETLYQLAKDYGYTVERFRAMNGLGKNDLIYVGQQLKVSECNCPNPNTADALAYAPAADRRVVAYNTNSTGGTPKAYSYVGTERLVAKGNESKVEYTDGKKRRFHVVKEDDTIFQISKKYGITVDQLRAINDLEDNEVIIPYQRIYLDY